MASSGLTSVVADLGYVAVALFVGIESFGVPLPGETMLITAAVFAGATHQLNIGGVIAASVGGAVIGDTIGFSIGWYGGFALVRRFGRYIRLDERRLKVGRYVFARYGGVVVFFGRFVVVLRAYRSLLAGINRMPLARFTVFNIAGGVAWSVFYGVAAYLLGSQITRFSVPIGIAFGAAAALILLAGIWVLRVNLRRLEDVAEQTFPGPLD